jgi:hypothetical protein
MRFIQMIILAALIALTSAPGNAQQSQRELKAATAQLFDAVRRKDLGAAQAAIAAGANIESKNSFGLRPVDLAIDLGNFDIAHYLLSVSNLWIQENTPNRLNPAAAPPAPPPVTAAPQPAVHPIPVPTNPSPLPPPPTLTGPGAFDFNAVPKTFAPPIIGDVLGSGSPDIGRVAPVPNLRLRLTNGAPPNSAPANAQAPMKTASDAASKLAPIAANKPVTPIHWPPIAATPATPAAKGFNTENLPAAETADNQTSLLSRFSDLFRGKQAASKAKAEALVLTPSGSSVQTPAASRPAAQTAVSPAPMLAPPTMESDLPHPANPAPPAVKLPVFSNSQPDTKQPRFLDRLTSLFSSSETTAEPPPQTIAPAQPKTANRAARDRTPAETTARVKPVTAIEIFAPRTNRVAEPAETPLPLEPPVSAAITTPDTNPSFFGRLTGWFRPSASASANVSMREIVAWPKRLTMPLRTGAPKVTLDALGLGKFKRLGQSRIVEKVSPDDCIEKHSWNVWFCVEAVNWPPEIAKVFTVDGSLYRGAKTIVRYDNDIATHFHTVFLAEDFDTVTAYFRKQLGLPSATPDIITPMVAAPPLRNPTLRWTSDGPGGRANLEIRQIDDLRWVMPDTRYGVVRLYREKSEPVFTLLSVSDLALARLRRPGGG